MNIHEYQAKQILATHGVPIPRGGVATSPDEAAAIAAEVGFPVVIKAQVHAGGRGKAGGIVRAESLSELSDAVGRLIGSTLVTAQSGARGRPVHSVLVEEIVNVHRELYVAVTVDRRREAVVIIASPQGGMDIETLASEHPELVFREHADPERGLLPFQARRLCTKLELRADSLKQGARLLLGLFEAFQAADATLAEINPLGLAANGQLVALDARMRLDDHGLARHPEMAALRDWRQEAPLEAEAAAYKLNYIKLDGNVGCMVNGAGLAMATMDLIAQVGGRPANFLDVGGGVTVEAVSKAFEILASDPDVRVALVNVLGGIVRCDTIAAGLVAAASRLPRQVPVVVRLEGTNAEEGRRLLLASDAGFELAANMTEAARRAVMIASAT